LKNFFLGCFTRQCGLLQKTDPNTQCWTSHFTEFVWNKFIFVKKIEKLGRSKNSCKNYEFISSANSKTVYSCVSCHKYCASIHFCFHFVISEFCAGRRTFRCQEPNRTEPNEIAAKQKLLTKFIQNLQF
jgi:hypothetical protein